MEKNREIKFRALHIESKRWQTFSLSEIGSMGIALVKMGDHLWKLVPTGQMFTALSEYTGLKDKNGKEVYEGDIVKDKYGVIADAHWSQETHGWRFIRNIGMFQTTNCEIVGNIYENPELLNL